MKQFSLLFLLGLLFISGNLSAHERYASTFSIIFLGSDRYSVVVDGREYRDLYEELYIDGISPGEHSIEIYRYSYDNEKSYNSGRMSVYKDYVYVPEGCDFIATFGGGRESRYELKIRNRSCYTSHGHCESCFKPQERCSCGKYTTKHDDDRHYYGNGLSESKLRDLVSLINSKGFDETKQSICKEVIAEYEITGKQLKDIVNTLSFESSKIDVAKYAIDQPYKIRDFYYIYDAFDFESSIDEITEYGRSKGYSRVK